MSPRERGRWNACTQFAVALALATGLTGVLPNGLGADDEDLVHSMMLNRVVLGGFRIGLSEAEVSATCASLRGPAVAVPDGHLCEVPGSAEIWSHRFEFRFCGAKTCVTEEITTGPGALRYHIISVAEMRVHLGTQPTSRTPGPDGEAVRWDFGSRHTIEMVASVQPPYTARAVVRAVPASYR